MLSVSVILMLAYEVWKLILLANWKVIGLGVATVTPSGRKNPKLYVIC